MSNAIFFVLVGIIHISNYYSSFCYSVIVIDVDCYWLDVTDAMINCRKRSLELIRFKVQCLNYALAEF